MLKFYIIQQNYIALFLLLFLSGIFYTAERVPEEWRELFFANPMAVFIDSYRRILLHDLMPEWERIVYVVVVTLLTATVVRALFRRLDLVYPKL